MLQRRVARVEPVAGTSGLQQMWDLAHKAGWWAGIG